MQHWLWSKILNPDFNPELCVEFSPLIVKDKQRTHIQSSYKQPGVTLIMILQLRILSPKFMQDFLKQFLVKTYGTL